MCSESTRQRQGWVLCRLGARMAIATMLRATPRRGAAPVTSVDAKVTMSASPGPAGSGPSPASRRKGPAA
ncbi:hypothetical protein GCM10009812_37110 [Nocardioides marinus]